MHASLLPPCRQLPCPKGTGKNSTPDPVKSASVPTPSSPKVFSWGPCASTRHFSACLPWCPLHSWRDVRELPRRQRRACRPARCPRRSAIPRGCRPRVCVTTIKRRILVRCWPCGLRQKWSRHPRIARCRVRLFLAPNAWEAKSTGSLVAEGDAELRKIGTVVNSDRLTYWPLDDELEA